MTYHQPVLLQECIDALNVDPDGIYVDVTFGGGGHSKEIVKKLKHGKLVAFDQDASAGNNVWNADNFIFIQQNFKYLKKYLRLYNLIPVNGILADLGISSHQIDTPERGFSTRFDADLDMRMDRSQKLTAKDVLNQYHEADLLRVFSKYGEVRNAKTLVKRILAARTKTSIKTVDQFKAVIHEVILGKAPKYLAQVFQALRIEVNKEMESLEEFLVQSAEVLKSGGRLCVISYHSLEDRMVKNFMKAGNISGEIEKDVFGNYSVPFKAVNKKPIVPGEKESIKNTRARSAKLRIAEKI